MYQTTELLFEVVSLKTENNNHALLNRNTRVLFYCKERHEYVMTNEEQTELELTRVFVTNKKWEIIMEGYLLGSIFAHDPYILQELEEVGCTFEELNPEYFDN